MLKNKSTLQAKLVKVFLIQVLLISLVTVGGIYAAKIMVEDVLVRQALEGEAQHFWEMRDKDPDFPPPDTMNLKTYLVTDGDYSSLPKELVPLSPGYQRAGLNQETPILYIEDKGNSRLYLIFDEVKVSRLALLFGILPLAGVLVVLYILAWIAYRQSHKAVSPIVKLAKSVRQAEIKDGSLPDLDLQELRDIPDDEVSSLVGALDQFTQRLELFIDRERHFTRDASHELRTPIAVLRSAMELLERRYDVANDKTMRRVYRTLYDMEALIETLLILAREEKAVLPVQDVDINAMALKQLDTLETLFQDKSITVDIDEQAKLVVKAPEAVVSILMSNLLRNAFNYTPKGHVIIKIWQQGFSVADSGVGMSEQQVKNVFEPFYRGERDNNEKGYGLGMTIVKRLCNRYFWHLRITSEIGKGTEVSVHFPKSQIES